MGSIYNLPSPINISFMWNFGSLVGLFLIIQIVSGLFLTIHYCPSIDGAFASIVHINHDVNYGWLIRYIHANGASFFLGLIYLHICRGVYYNRYYNTYAWLVSVLMLSVSMLTGFLGYVLPWGQISFWGATVITNFITAIPIWGVDIVKWVWGSYCVDNPTLNRFYTFHFLFPFLLVVLSVGHLVFIHSSGSGNPVSGFSDSMKIPFWPYFGVKDILGFFVVLFFFVLVVLFLPDVFGDPDNHHNANPMVTPVNIKPEWYFLFAYAILRCIPNKGISVLALVGSIVVFAFLPLGRSGYSGNLPYQVVFWSWAMNFCILTWLGGCHVKVVFTYIAQICGFLYFSLLFLLIVV